MQEIPFPNQEIHQHYLNGYLTYEKSIERNEKQLKCLRCGNEDRRKFASHQCGRCNRECVYCRHCIMMGKVSECQPLVRWIGPPLTYQKGKDELNWDGELSYGQKQASSEVVHAIQKNEELLVWAVCGAGKTEVLFEGISVAIAAGKKVLIATPRSDVVVELMPRIKKVFPTTSVIALYGNSRDRGKDGQLVISTTHQLVRYDDAFDVIIVDEVDAFPYSFDPMLAFAVKSSAKNNASIIYLSATPDDMMKKRVNVGELRVVKIPKRYHGHPLPVPRLCWAGNWPKLIKRGKIPNVVVRWVQSILTEQKQALIFIPSVVLLTIILPIFQMINRNIVAVHAEDPQRRSKVQQFRDGKITILLTTTILERGVTVPNIAVGVFGAEEKVFTESALVQIAGRAGRSADYPDGDVVFFHYGKTKAIVKAIQHIKEMNRMGGRYQ